MNYVGRKDDGRYITPKVKGDVIKFDADLNIPIAYNKEIADLAAAKRIKYRTAFIEAYKASKGDE